VFQPTVTETRWHPAERLWHVSTDRGDHMKARFVVCANGTLAKPKLAKINGMERFEGRSFHTSRWDCAYTGSDLSALAGKVVGIVGPGASAVQIVPQLGASAKHLYVSVAAYGGQARIPTVTRAWMFNGKRLLRSTATARTQLRDNPRLKIAVPSTRTTSRACTRRPSERTTGGPTKRIVGTTIRMLRSSAKGARLANRRTLDATAGSGARVRRADVPFAIGCWHMLARINHHMFG
jgi:cation diffusion facilitator CzcD-associated flavoprotein CzcO